MEQYLWDLGDIELKIYFLKTFFIIICTYYTFLKIINKEKLEKIAVVKSYIYLFIISIVISTLKDISNYFITIITLIFLLGLLFSNIGRYNLGYSILISIISLSFNYIIFFGAIIINYVINKIYPIYNDILNLIIMIIIHMVFLYKILTIKKLKNGIIYFVEKSQNNYFEIIVLNISTIIILSIILLPYINEIIGKNLIVGLIIFSTIMIITIQKSFQLYYKHKLLIKELDETKAELDNAKQDITELEKENLEISKKSHSLAHKQRSLEHKIDTLMLKTETAEEIGVKDELNDISKELYENAANVELTKTDITVIDDMLDCMKADCEKENIDFNLQINGNIHHMVNSLISKEELEILIADHIRDAIIAIKHSENINRSILVRLGKIDEYFGLYIYDTGIEFEKETLENIGKRPYTTHKDEGGTGLGFMNTFETLKRHKASLIIEEIGKPCKDNFTKIIKIRFDEKDEFKVISYKEN